MLSAPLIASAAADPVVPVLLSLAVVLFAAVNGLKAVNDTSGHTAGDALLQRVAATLRESLRDADVVARLGGDEFAAVLSGSDDPTTVVDRLWQAVEGRNLRRADTESPISLALGAAVFDPDRPEPLDALVARADTAMYEMKWADRSGLDEVVHS